MNTEPTQAMREIEKAIDALLKSQSQMSAYFSDADVYLFAVSQRDQARARLVRLIEEAMK